MTRVLRTARRRCLTGWCENQASSGHRVRLGATRWAARGGASFKPSSGLSALFHRHLARPSDDATATTTNNSSIRAAFDRALSYAQTGGMPRTAVPGVAPQGRTPVLAAAPNPSPVPTPPAEFPAPEPAPAADPLVLAEPEAAGGGTLARLRPYLLAAVMILACVVGYLVMRSRTPVVEDEDTEGRQASVSAAQNLPGGMFGAQASPTPQMGSMGAARPSPQMGVPPSHGPLGAVQQQQVAMAMQQQQAETAARQARMAAHGASQRDPQQGHLGEALPQGQAHMQGAIHTPGPPLQQHPPMQPPMQPPGPPMQPPGPPMQPPGPPMQPPGLPTQGPPMQPPGPPMQLRGAAQAAEQAPAEAGASDDPLFTPLR